MRRIGEAIGSGVGVMAGSAAGAKFGAHIGIAVGGPVGAIVGTVPCAIIGGVIGLLSGNKIGSEVDRHHERREFHTKKSDVRPSVYQGLEEIYAPLERNHMRIFCAFMESSIEFESGFSSDHYYLRAEGCYDGSSFPLPVVTIPGTCDIMINIGSIDFYAYLPSQLSCEVLRKFHIRDAVELQQANGCFLFRMAEDESEAVILGFSEELRKVGAYI